MQQAPVVQGVPVAPGPEGTPQLLGQVCRTITEVE